MIGALVNEIITEPSWWWWDVAKTPPQPIAIISYPAMQNQLSFLIPFAQDRLHIRAFVRFLIGASVVEVFTEPWWWVEYGTDF